MRQVAALLKLFDTKKTKNKIKRWWANLLIYQFLCLKDLIGWMTSEGDFLHESTF